MSVTKSEQDMDSLSEAKLKDLHPLLAGKIRQLDAAYWVAYMGDNLRVMQGLRSWEQQKALWDQGRGLPGRIVTYAEPGHSWHNFGLAADVCPILLLSVKDWGPSDPKWERLGVLGETCGLIWGGRWEGKKRDLPHFQLTGSMPVSPNDHTRDAYLEHGVEGVWSAAGLAIPHPVDIDGEISV